MGASPPGRTPRRTKTVGAGGDAASSLRIRPRPSVRQRSERPTTSSPAPSASADTLSRPGSGVRQRPGEAGPRLSRCEAAGADTAPDEHRRCRRRRCELAPDPAEPLCSPAIGETDDEKSGALGERSQALPPRAREQRLSRNPCRPLDDQRGVGEQAAGVPPVRVCVRSGPDQAKRLPVRAGEPGRELECSPVVLRGAERDEDRSRPRAALRRRAGRRRMAPSRAVASFRRREQAAPSRRDDEICFVPRCQARDVRSEGVRREGGGASSDPFGGELRSCARRAQRSRRRARPARRPGRSRARGPGSDCTSGRASVSNGSTSPDPSSATSTVSRRTGGPPVPGRRAKGRARGSPSGAASAARPAPARAPRRAAAEASWKRSSASAWRPERYRASISWPWSLSRYGCSASECLEVGNELAVPAEREVGLHALLERDQLAAPPGARPRRRRSSSWSGRPEASRARAPGPRGASRPRPGLGSPAPPRRAARSGPGRARRGRPGACSPADE